MEFKFLKIISVFLNFISAWYVLYAEAMMPAVPEPDNKAGCLYKAACTQSQKGPFEDSFFKRTPMIHWSPLSEWKQRCLCLLRKKENKMNTFKEIRMIAALLTIIVVFMASSTYAEASVPEYRHNICAFTQDEDYFSIECCGNTTIEKGGELHFRYSRSAGLAGLPVVWKVSDGNIAKISDGQLTAYRAGTVRVTASCGRFSSSCCIVVR